MGQFMMALINFTFMALDFEPGPPTPSPNFKLLDKCTFVIAEPGYLTLAIV